VNVIVVDTSSWISYFSNRNSNDIIDLALKEGRVYLSPVVVSELLSAQLKPAEKKQMVDFLNDLPLCEISFDHWVRVGSLRSRLLKKGLKTSTPDTHIAQCCIDLDCFLLSEDKIFKKISKHSSLKCL
jgi:tRNA(fMet)-specific endonuclease VapC